jgi:hypothetical protein
MSASPEADLALDRFIDQLTLEAARVGWTIVRFVGSHSDRQFELRTLDRSTLFTVKVSLTEKAFWGLTEAKANEMQKSMKEHLLLLVGDSRGYFISNVAFSRLLPKFSRTKEQAVRINPNVVRAEVRFSDASEAFDLLSAKSLSRSDR